MQLIRGRVRSVFVLGAGGKIELQECPYYVTVYCIFLSYLVLHSNMFRYTLSYHSHCLLDRYTLSSDINCKSLMLYSCTISACITFIISYFVKFSCFYIILYYIISQHFVSYCTILFVLYCLIFCYLTSSHIALYYLVFYLSSYTTSSCHMVYNVTLG